MGAEMMACEENFDLSSILDAVFDRQCATRLPPVDEEEPVAAEKREGEKRPDVCKHWVRGFCNRGDACGFAHTGPQGVPPAQAEAHNLFHGEICKDFTSGKCSRNKRCKFLHTGTPVVPMCRDYIGNAGCKRGSQCKFMHPAAKAKAAADRVKSPPSPPQKAPMMQFADGQTAMIPVPQHQPVQIAVAPQQLVAIPQAAALAPQVQQQQLLTTVPVFIRVPMLVNNAMPYYAA